MFQLRCYETRIVFNSSGKQCIPKGGSNIEGDMFYMISNNLGLIDEPLPVEVI